MHVTLTYLSDSGASFKCLWFSYSYRSFSGWKLSYHLKKDKETNYEILHNIYNYVYYLKIFLKIILKTGLTCTQ